MERFYELSYEPYCFFYELFCELSSFFQKHFITF